MERDKSLLLAEAVLGRDAEDFLRSELGRYLLGRFEQEEREALEALCDMCPTSPEEIRKHQNAVWRARHAKQWLVDLVSAGQHAETILETFAHE